MQLFFFIALSSLDLWRGLGGSTRLARVSQSSWKWSKQDPGHNLSGHGHNIKNVAWICYQKSVVVEIEKVRLNNILSLRYPVIANVI